MPERPLTVVSGIQMFMSDDGPTEFDLGKTIIDGIVESGSVDHLVYSSAVSTSTFSQGEAAAKAAESKQFGSSSDTDYREKAH